MKTPSKINFEIQLFVYKDPESEMYVAYCNSLDLSSYGEDQEDAIKAFENTLDIFLEETTAKGTLENVLVRLGWNLSLTAYWPPAPSIEKLSHLLTLNPKIEKRSIPLQMA